MRWRDHDGMRWLEADLPAAKVAFSARLGGISEPPFASLNLGILTGDERERVRANRLRLAEALGLDPARVAIARQVHGCKLAEHDGPQVPAPYLAQGDDPPELDGHRTRETDLGLMVFVADCLPIAIAGDSEVGMLHGGWRGLAGGIVGRGVIAVGARAAAIGPHIGPCCYEVGEEVLRAFAPLGDGIADGRMLDLAAAAHRLLTRAGVEEIETSDLCTRCNPDLLFSHRGEGPETGRQAGIAWRVA
jgi:polyphenol oxidase